MMNLPINKKIQRKILTFLCIVVIIILFILIGYNISNIIKIYNTYRYENNISKLQLPEVTEPSNINIIIGYVNKEPIDIQILDDKKNTKINQDINITKNTDEKMIIIDFDTDKPNKNYVLTLKPQDNYELTYQINQTLSKKHAIYDLEFITNKKQEKILKITASYEHSDEPIRAVLRIKGENSKNHTEMNLTSETMDITKENNTVKINVSDLINNIQVKSMLLNIYVKEPGQLDPVVSDMIDINLYDWSENNDT